MANGRALFHTAHYNILAAQFNEAFNAYVNENLEHEDRLARISAIVSLALSMAKRFKEDNPSFDVHKWLDQCSADADLYPLSELWETYSK